MAEPSDFSLIEQAFGHAVDLPPGERTHFVATFAREHPALADALRKLLNADEDEENPLQVRFARSVDALSDSENDHWLGRTVGSWIIRKRIGTGGMGAVFLAERTASSYSQRAALKIMAAQLINADAVARFRTERQILAHLDHPNIARLIDGGSTDDGVPFLVMELVTGVPIDAALDAKSFSLDDRLRLFIKVCRAVDFAHRKLIVHRDLKPSNILIDERGEPKLLDFGIAKLLEPGAYDMTALQTGLGARALTPEYASPEQIRAEPVSIATDIYALGVLLFKLLTGSSPYPGASSQREVEDAILNKEPKRPSAALSSSSSGTMPSLWSGAEGGAASLRRLRSRLSGDLDNIVLKCLQKEPERRYTTAVALADDLEAYLSGRPISARGDELFYTARKFVRRHATALTTATLVTAGAIGLTVFYTQQLKEERDRAQLAARESAEVTQFLSAIFKNANPLLTDGPALPTIDLVRAAEKEISALDQQPVLQASLMQIIGSVFSILGEYDRGIALLERAMATRQLHPFADILDLAQLHHDLSEAYREAYRLTEAEEHIREALRIRNEHLPPTHEKVFETQVRLAVNLSDQNRKTEALDILKDVQQRREAVGPKDDRLTLDILGNLAHLYTDTGDYENARRAHERAVPLSERLDGPLHPNTIIRINNKGLFHSAVWEDDKAVAAYSEALARAEQIWTPERAELGSWLTGRAYARLFLGQFEEALADNERSVEYAIIARGRQSGLYFLTQKRYAQTLIALARYEEARDKLTPVFEEARDLLGEDDMTTRQLRFSLSEVEVKAGRPDIAEGWIKERLRQLEEGTLYNPDMRVTLYRLVDIRSRQGRVAEADEALEKLLAAQRAALGAESPGMIASLLLAAEHRIRSGAPEGALEAALEARRIAENRLPRDGWWHGRTLLAEAEARHGLGEAAAAASLAARSAAILARSLDDTHPLLISARRLEVASL